MFKKLFKYLKPYFKETFLAIIFTVLETILELIVPFLMNFILQNNLGITYNQENIITSYNLPFLLTIGGIMIGCAILAFAFGIFSAKYVAICGRGLGAELRKEEYKKIQDFSFNNLDHFRTSSLITRLTNDITIIQDSFCQSFRAALRSPVMLVFSFILAFIISPYLGLVFLVAVPVLGILLFIVLKVVSPKFVALQKIVDRLNRTTQESIIAIKTIKGYVKEDYEIEKFEDVNHDLVKTSSSAFATISLNMPIIQFVTYATIICLLFFGAQFFNQGLIKDVSEISTFLSYIMQLLSSLMMLSNVFMLVNRSSASVRRVFEVLETNSEVNDNLDSKLTINDGSVSFNNVSFKYDASAKEYTLRNINMKIANGEFVGIVGQTGSGKTTIINLIEKFYNINSGEILINNKDINSFSTHEIHDKIAINFQNPVLFSGTVLDNLKWGNDSASMDEIINATKIACCYDFIMNQLEDGFNTKIGQSGTNVSGGQRQRLCIARSILKNPKIVIFDDSFSALDRITEKELIKHLKEDLKGITKIVISQKISTIKDASKIFVINDGEVENCGTHDELIKNDEIYKSIYSIQNEGKIE